MIEEIVNYEGVDLRLQLHDDWRLLVERVDGRRITKCFNKRYNQSQFVLCKNNRNFYLSSKKILNLINENLIGKKLEERFLLSIETILEINFTILALKEGIGFDLGRLSSMTKKYDPKKITLLKEVSKKYVEASEKGLELNVNKHSKMKSKFSSKRYCLRLIGISTNKCLIWAKRFEIIAMDKYNQ